MLRIKAMRELRLNCSSGGVLYHYTRTTDSLNEILEEGLKPSDRFEQNREGKTVPFISFSRTRVSPPYFHDGANSWKYGIMFSRNKISNLGKLTPYRHGGYGHEDDPNRFEQLTMIVKDPEFIARPEDNLYPVTIAIQHTGRKRSRIRVAIGSKNVNNLWSSFERLTPEDANKLGDWLIQNERKTGLKIQKVIETTEENKKFNDGTKYVVVSCFGKVNLDELSTVLPELPKELLQESIEQMDESDMGTESATTVDMQLNLGEESRTYRFSQRFTKKDIMDIYNRISAIDYSRDERDDSTVVAADADINNGHWELVVNGTKEEIEQIFHDKPSVLKEIKGVDQYRVQESEDRLWLPNADREKPVPGTKEAIIGLIFPRDEYYSDEANAIREKYPNLPIYAYAEYRSPGLAKDSKPVPKEAYKNPIA